MSSLRNVVTRLPSNGQFAAAARPVNSAAFYRRIAQQSQITQIHYASSTSSKSTALRIEPLRPIFLPSQIRSFTSTSPQNFFGSSRTQEEKKPQAAEETAKQEPAAEGEAEKKASGENAEENTKKEGEEGEGESKKEKEKEAPPPPPPHGDKSPWQVFTETLQSEFKASKEWNDSTKALAAGAQQFTENENVRKARQAYESTTGAVSSTTGKVLKSTAGAVGKGAAWTWETPVVKAARTTVNATASVIEKGTRPIRETEAYKNVKNVIDDGSSSRYGGWVEKEERRKARELREAQEAKALGLDGKRVEVMQEDPE